MLDSYLAVDLGTANTRIYTEGEGIVDEPSVVAISVRDGAVEAVGAPARQMLGRAPDRVRTEQPIRQGAIADLAMTRTMLTAMLDRTGRRGFRRLKAVVSVPGALTDVERRAVANSVREVGVSELCVADELLAGAIGAGLPVNQCGASMIVDIGAGITEAAVISLGGIVVHQSVPVGGDNLDSAIQDWVRSNHNLWIGPRTAERAKIEIGAAALDFERRTTHVSGRHAGSGLPHKVLLSDAEVRMAIEPYIRSFIDVVRATIDQTPPELSADLIDNGVLLTGGGALLRNLDRVLASDVGLSFRVAEQPMRSVVLGAGQMMKSCFGR